MSTPDFVEHFFRHEYGRLVATLARRVGVQNIEAVEDAAQTALMRALAAWPRGEVPDNPSAWLYSVARNELVGGLRQHARRARLLDASTTERVELPEHVPFLATEVKDDLLRMLFVCCDDAIPPQSQLVLALKVLCGFDVREIAHRLFASEAKIYKRLSRARERLREVPLGTDSLDGQAYRARLPAVNAILYLLFTEGHLSTRAGEAIRRELCEEAIRLAKILVEHPTGQTPETFALLALMHLHAARIDARDDGAGGLLLLEEQDRSTWDRDRIAVGLDWLEKSAQGDTFSRFHAEAGIAAEHCMAPSFETTRWDRIASCYEILERAVESPLHRLNRAVAVAQWKGPAAGLAVLDGYTPPAWLAGSYAWAAVLADLHRRAGHVDEAAQHRRSALELAPTPAVRALLARRLG